MAPSANRSGHVSPTTAQHVLADLRGRIELIVDGGPTPVGLESTIVACLDRPLMLRPGALARADIERWSPSPIRRCAAVALPGEPPLAPGQLASTMRRTRSCASNATRVDAGEALLGFGPTRLEGAGRRAWCSISRRAAT